ncbi:hypothetical protein B0H10DRAFT_2080108 [Mycena sp. CBHHK59/15]|nr:hypothetical protein B0H10DRAFT_2080108 [Mycena sp. CBHHK59/15]
MSSATEYRDKHYVAPPIGRAKEHPLKRGDEFELNLTVPSKNSDPRSRPVPFIPVTAGSSRTRVQLLDGLQTGLGHFSQVWTARIVAAPETTLIFKIIQPSMCYCDGEWKNDVHPDDLAGNEAWAYEHLKEKQGLYVPYFFGFHQIKTPSKEEAWVLVLEHIPGPTLTTVAKSKSWDDIYRSCELGFNLVREITNIGLLLHDIRGPNFILTGPPGAQQVVGIDFQPMTVIAPTHDLVHVAHMREHEFFNVMLDHFSAEDCEKMLKWAQEKFPAGAYIWG